ncbi:MAG: sialate O-acetylesterase [Flavicella sp.]
MKTIHQLLFLLSLSFSFITNAQGKHLFILSGQSNMARLKPELSFVPTLHAKYGKEKVLVVKDAQGGQPIRRWYRDWQPAEGIVSENRADLYKRMLGKVDAAIAQNEISTVTFIWMQGERDAKESHGEVYEKSLLGLYEQLSKDLKRNDIHFIIGRLSDFDLQNKKSPHWTMIREVQVKVAQSNPRFDWVNTDDLNDGLDKKQRLLKNGLHMSIDGYRIMGSRFAEKAIALIEQEN